MKKIFLSIITISLLLMSCSDWTEVEGIEIIEPNIAKQNPELYANYLEDLRAYKKSPHKLSYVWFDNSNKTPIDQSDHLLTLPDSIDVVSIMHPDSLADWELAEVEKIREDKGTKVIFTMDFDKIKIDYDNKRAAYEEAMNEAEDNTEVNVEKLPDFISFLVNNVKNQLALVKEYNYDGISLAYTGMSTLHMTEAEKRIHTAYEKAFIGIAEDWYARNNDKMICFEGYPQNLLDKTILNSCTNIILPCKNVNSSSELSYKFIKANVEGVPTDRFIIAVTTTSLDQADVKTGYWAEMVPAIDGTANWIASSIADNQVAGIGIYQVNNDYYNPTFIFEKTRNAINTMNPSPKKNKK